MCGFYLWLCALWGRPCGIRWTGGSFWAEFKKFSTPFREDVMKVLISIKSHAHDFSKNCATGLTA